MNEFYLKYLVKDKNYENIVLNERNFQRMFTFTYNEL